MIFFGRYFGGSKALSDDLRRAPRSKAVGEGASRQDFGNGKLQTVVVMRLLVRGGANRWALGILQAAAIFLGL